MYNWKQKSWPKFTYNLSKIEGLLYSFAETNGKLNGVLKTLPKDTHVQTILNTLVTEAIKTSEIEGEFLDKEVVLSSIKKNLGLHPTVTERKDDKAKGIALVTTAVQKTFKKPLTITMLYEWHCLMFPNDKKLEVGKWRTHKAPMQVISGALGKEKVHFEAPPSSQVPAEMEAFISWFNSTAPNGDQAIKQPPVRAAIAHLYFESIHPFEDGNGRMGRAVAEKALSQSIGSPSLLSMSTTMSTYKKRYYTALSKGQQSNEITPFITYFVKMLLQAQKRTEDQINFTLKKTKFYEEFLSQFNDRQKKVVERIFKEGLNGFEGGMNATKYARITKTSKATATRDLQKMLELGAFKVIGGGRSTRYFLNYS